MVSLGVNLSMEYIGEELIRHLDDFNSYTGLNLSLVSCSWVILATTLIMLCPFCDSQSDNQSEIIQSPSSGCDSGSGDESGSVSISGSGSGSGSVSVSVSVSGSRNCPSRSISSSGAGKGNCHLNNKRNRYCVSQSDSASLSEDQSSFSVNKSDSLESSEVHRFSPKVVDSEDSYSQTRSRSSSKSQSNSVPSQSNKACSNINSPYENYIDYNTGWPRERLFYGRN